MSRIQLQITLCNTLNYVILKWVWWIICAFLWIPVAKLRCQWISDKHKNYML